MCIKTAVVVLLGLRASSLSYAAVKLADLVSPCSIKDPRLNDCLTTQGKAMLPLLLPGVEDLDAVPIDPLFVPHYTMQRKGGSFQSLNVTLSNTTHVAYKDVVINSIRFEPQSLELRTSLFFPWYNLSGFYDMNGYILLLPIRGKGALKKLCLRELNMTSAFQFETENRDGTKYLKLNDAESQSTIRSGIIQFEGLFGNAYLSDIMNDFLTSNSLAVYQELGTQADEMLSYITSSVLSRMFAKIPLNQLFKDVE